MTRETIIQWNVQELTTSKEDFLNLIELYRPLVMSIQKTQQINEYLTKISGYKSISKKGKFNRRHEGVALYVPASMPFQEINLNTELQALVAVVKNVFKYKTMCVSSLYTT